MSEAEEAWRLWQLLHLLSNALWERYESAFMDFCGESDRSTDVAVSWLPPAGERADDLPF